MSPILHTLATDWREHLQVGVIVLLLIALLRALGGSRARRAAIAAVALVLVYLGLRAFRLWILASLVERVLDAGVVLVAVLFRDEVRALLVRISRRAKLLTGRGARASAAARVVEEIATAADRLSAARYGAILAVEMEDPLSAWAETGFTVDAAITAPLVEAIFTSHSPLHDGAVIVRGDRILAAGAVLPLHRGDTPELRRHGTRHRAALGIAALTDAAVVVVSEETGEIRVARHGRFIPVSGEHTRRELVALLTNDEPDAGGGDRTVAAALAEIAVWGGRLLSALRSPDPERRG